MALTLVQIIYFEKEQKGEKRGEKGKKDEVILVKSPP